MSAALRERALPWIIPITLFAAWEALAHSGVADPRFLPSLEQIASTAVSEVRDDDLLGHVLASLQRDLLGFVIGSAIGVALGLLIGFSRLAQRMVGPLLLVHRQIALFAWIPLLSMWFGGGEAGKLSFIALAAFQPTLSNTWQGVANIPGKFRELAAVLTFSRLDMVRLVALPAALPSIFTGLQSALIYAWVATIGAELLLNVAPGIGGRMNEGEQLFHMDLLLLCVLLMGAVGIVFNLLAARLQTRLLRWRTL
jgi:sulfonate transport system permease protein